MKLYLKEKDLLTKFDLSNEVSGSFLFTHVLNESGREISINIDAKDGKWVLKSNGITNIANGQMFISSIELQNYMTIPIYIKGLDYYLYIYTFPSLEDVLISYYVDELTEIKIGSDESNNIIYALNGVSPNHAIISKEEDLWFISPVDKNNEVYLNNIRIHDKVRLLIGDTIFINGLKVIWMGIFFKVTNYDTCFKINGIRSNSDVNPIDNNEYLETPDDLAEFDSLVNRNYFSHIPRIINVNTSNEVEIDAPPGRQDLDDGMPLVLSMASSMAMMSMSVISVIGILTLTLKMSKPLFYKSLLIFCMLCNFSFF